MAFNTQPEYAVHDSATSKHDFAVQPVGDKDVVPVDGPLPDDVDGSAIAAIPAVDKEVTSSPSSSPIPGPNEAPVDKSESPTSPLHTRKESIGSATTLEDDKIREDVVEDPEDSQGNPTVREVETTEAGAHAVEVDEGSVAGMCSLTKDVQVRHY